MNNNQHIQDYIQGKLNKEDRQSFEESLQKNKTLKGDFEDYKSVQKAFKLNEAERLKSKLQAHEKDNSSGSSFNFRPFFYAIAASVLVLIGMNFYFNFFQQDLYGQYFETYPNVYQPVVRGSAEESTKAFMYYENGDFVNAQEAFKNLLKDKNNPNIRFYYALSLLNEDQVEPAIAELKALKDIDFEFSAEVYWYYGLAELKLENLENAIVMFNELRLRFPKYKPEEVKELLNDLE
jgi:tetratricopeptide (TPR) repeat protein